MTARVSQNDFRNIKGSLHTILALRHYVYPFPYSTHDASLREIMMSMMPKEQVDAILTLERDRRFWSYMYKTTEFVFVCNTKNVMLRMDKYHLFPAGGHPPIWTMEEDNPYYPKLALWVERMALLNSKARKASQLYEMLEDTCNTVGQLTRAWPEIVHYIPNYLQGGPKPQRASQLPRDLDMLIVNQLRNDATEYLATASMFRSKEDTEIHARLMESVE